MIGNLRDFKSILSYILFPIILIMILGSALSAAFAPTNIGDIQVVVTNEDDGETGDKIIEFLEDDEFVDFLHLTKNDNLEDAKSEVNEGNQDVLVYINKDYSQKLEDSEKNSVEIMSINESDYKVTIVNQILESYISGLNTVFTSLEYDPTNPSYEMVDLVDEQPITVEGNLPQAIDFYVVTILVMVLMYGTAVSAKEFENNLKGEMGRRIRTAPLRSSTVLLSKLAASVVIVFIQGTIVAAISKYAFGANLGDDPMFVLSIILLGAILGCGLGILVCLLVDDPEKVGGVLTILVPVMTFLSGGFIGGSFMGIEKVMPNYYLQNALFNNIYGSGSVNMSLAYIFIYILIILILALIIGRRRTAW